MTTPRIPLASGGSVPQLGFGTYKISAGDAERAVLDALQLGYRHIDAAAMYGNEPQVGRALARSGLARDELFVTSKLDNPFHAAAAVRPAFERSLDDLGLDALDLYLIHWPLAGSTDIVATWAAVVGLLGTGRVRAVGVSNFTAVHLQAIIAATGVVPTVNQIEVNPYLTQEPLRALHQELGIVTEAWSPLARGRILDDPVVLGLGDHLGCTPSQVVLAWHLQRGDVVFPKSTRPERMEENLGSLDVTLDAGAMQALNELNRDERSGSDPDVVELHGGRRSGQ